MELAARARNVAIVGALLGAILVLASSLLGGTPGLGLFVFVAWALAPWGLLLVLARWVHRPWLLGGAAATALACEAGVRGAVFLFPTSSTSALLLVVSPVLVGIAGAAGGLAGEIFGLAWRTGSLLLRLVASLSAAAALGLLVLALARPEQTPWEREARRETLEEIGAPGVRLGAEAFESRVVFPAAAWFQAADLDGVPGEEIAVVQEPLALLFDPVSLEQADELRITPSPGAFWSWFSRLARLDERVVVVQTGGGFSATEIRETDGSVVWEHRPNPELVPTALLPADLDADGVLELYAAESEAVARLDPRGHVVWRRPSRYGVTLLLSTPRRADRPAWVAAREGGRLRVWDETGQLLAEAAPVAEHGSVALVDLGEERVILSGGERLRATTLGGELLFELDLGRFSLDDAVSVRFAPEAPAHIALSASAPREVQRWRFLLLAPDGNRLYDEVFENAVRPLAARTASGADALLLAGPTLRSLSPRRP